MKRKNYPCESTFSACADGDIPAENAISQYQSYKSARTLSEAHLRQSINAFIKKGGNLL